MRIISGIKPSGEPHIGNYLGAIKNWLNFQQDNECVFFIADLHSQTVPYEPESLQDRIREIAISYLAAGLDPKKCVFFTQSQVKEHSELFWYLNTLTSAGDLQRMTQFKEQSQKFKKNINAGLLNYPILMAADILLYQAEAVPVGDDQVQHLELAKTIARKFNSTFGQTFKEPKPILPQTGARIMSLSDPKKKMSKSDPGGEIRLFEDPESIRKKIMSAVTDSGKNIAFDPKKKPGISNLLQIYASLSSKTIKEAESHFHEKSYAEFKARISETVIKVLEPFRRKKEELSANLGLVESILEKGAKRARQLCLPTIEDVRKKMGLK